MTDSAPENDPSIADEIILWRRIHPEQVALGENNEPRPSSAAFRNTKNTSGMSVNIANESTVQDTMSGCDGFFLVEFEVSFVRGLNQGVVRRPQTDNPAHAEVTGSKSKSIRNKFSAGSRWVIRP